MTAATSSSKAIYAAAGDAALSGQNVLIVDPNHPHHLFGGIGDRISAFSMIGSGMIWRTRPTFPGLAALATAADAVFWVGSADLAPLAPVSYPVADSLDLDLLRQAMAECRRRSAAPHSAMRTIESLAIAASITLPQAQAM